MARNATLERWISENACCPHCGFNFQLEGTGSAELHYAENCISPDVRELERLFKLEKP